jgi:hypothetical protein
MEKLILPMFLFLNIFVAPAYAVPFDWNNNLTFCGGVSSSSFLAQLPKFKAKVSDGKVWESDVAVEKAALTKLISVTCPAYLANPNGDTSLTTFNSAYADVTKRALATKATADSIQAYFDSVFQAQKKTYLGAGVAFESFPCGKAMKASETHLANEETFIVSQFQALQVKCPAIAKLDATTAAALRAKPAAVGQGSGTGAGSDVKGNSQNPSSTITGSDDEKAPPSK